MSWKHSIIPIIITVICLVLVACAVEPTPPPSVLPTPTLSPLPPVATGFEVITKEDTTVDILQALLDFCINAGLQTILALCVVDVGFGIGAALKKKAFDWKKVGDFYLSQILALAVPYIATLAALALVPGLIEFLPAEAAPALLLVGIMAKLGGSIIGNAGILRNGA